MRFSESDRRGYVALCSHVASKNRAQGRATPTTATKNPIASLPRRHHHHIILLLLPGCAKTAHADARELRNMMNGFVCTRWGRMCGPRARTHAHDDDALSRYTFFVVRLCGVTTRAAAAAPC